MIVILADESPAIGFRWRYIGHAMGMLQDQSNFRTEIHAPNEHLVVPELASELDFPAMLPLQAALDSAVCNKPRILVINSLRADFISVQAFSAIGCASKEVERLRFHARSGFPRRIFEFLGFTCCRAAPAADDASGLFDGQPSDEIPEWLVVGLPAPSRPPTSASPIFDGTYRRVRDQHNHVLGGSDDL